ncbi:MAG: zinc ribbon domain-containing protein [Deltaproteobacteria bacterium]|nr:zinc ribbon domain-containing protein [Deltaproteobacteria bacterium]
MPVYEYECQQCKQVTEAMQKFSDAPLTQCPRCSGQLRKMISQSAFHLKGSGWYVTDYARKGDSTPAGKKDKPAETSNQSSEKSSDSAANAPAPAPSSGTSETK